MAASISHMRQRAASPTTGPAARFERLIRAIGEPHFGQTVFETLNVLSGADRCLVVQATTPTDWTCIIDAGTSAKAPQDVFLGFTNLLPRRADQKLRRRRAARHAGIADIFAFAASGGRRAYNVFVARERNGSFSAEQLAALALGAEIVGASIIKDRQRPDCPFDRGDGVITRIVMCSGAYDCLTSREKSVCVGILTGHTTEAIALHLGISANSVLTFRRRLYQKLGIGSQNELFMRVLETAKSL